MKKWNPRRILNWANSIGVNTTALMEKIMENRSHPTRGYKSCMAILSFSKTYVNGHENIRGSEYYSQKMGCPSEGTNKPNEDIK